MASRQYVLYPHDVTLEVSFGGQQLKIKAQKYGNTNPARTCYLCQAPIEVGEYYYRVFTRRVAPYPISICTDPGHAREV